MDTTTDEIMEEQVVLSLRRGPQEDSEQKNRATGETRSSKNLARAAARGRVESQHRKGQTLGSSALAISAQEEQNQTHSSVIATSAGIEQETDWDEDERDYGEDEIEDEPYNPYDYNFDKEAGRYMTDDVLKAHLAHLPQVPVEREEGKRCEKLVIDKVIVASRIVHLQTRGIIMYTVDFNPTRDYFVDWAFEVLGRNLKVNIEQIRVLARYTFMVVFTEPEEQKAVLLEPHFYMGKKMIIAMPWTVDFDTNAMRSQIDKMQLVLPQRSRNAALFFP